MTQFLYLILYPFLFKGWGRTDQCVRQLSPNLKETTQKVITDTECEKFKGFYRFYNESTKECKHKNDNYKNLIKEEMICGHSKGTSSCQGDSGGPYTVEKKEQHILVGVGSWGFGCAEVKIKK